MGHGTEHDYWDRAELLDAAKGTYMKLYKERPASGLYDELEIKALEAELRELRGELINREIMPKK